MKSESVIGETALVTGALGQDGHYITRQLKRQGFRVFGTTKHNVTPHDGISYLTCDSTSPSDVNLLFDLVHPDLIFHLSGKTNDYETGVQEENNKGLDTILEATRKHSPQSRFFFAGSAFMFGRPTTVPQIETTPPNSAREYGRSKTYGFRRVAEARKAGLFACTGILYNHISPHCSKKKPQQWWQEAR